MNIQELETIVHNNLPIKIFLINNGEYGIIKQTQNTWMDGRYTASDPNSGVGFPNLAKIANAYGIPVLTIEDHIALQQHIIEVLNHDGYILCDVKIKSGEQILPKLVFGKGIEDMAPLIPREEFQEIMNNE
jgi:acetolactate synthase-1/2/3 large subunit